MFLLNNNAIPINKKSKLIVFLGIYGKEVIQIFQHTTEGSARYDISYGTFNIATFYLTLMSNLTHNKYSVILPFTIDNSFNLHIY